MKKKYLLLSGLLIILVLSGCKPKEDESSSRNFDNDASYAFGMAYGWELKNNFDMGGIKPNYDEFLKGFKDSMTGKNTRFDIDEAMAILNDTFNSMTEERVSGMIQDETSFLAENSKKPGIMITPSGLQYEIIKEGSGAERPSASDTVVVHYTGTLTDGSFFDGSRDRGEPAQFPLDGVIPGWTEGIQLMSVGSNYIFYVPSNLAYGAEGITNPMTGQQIIPQYAVLIFDVELLDIIRN